MKNFFLISFLFLFIDVYTCNHDNFVDENEVRYFEVDDINEYSQNVLRSSIHWKNFLEANPNWFVVFDELTKLPNKAFGDPFATALACLLLQQQTAEQGPTQANPISWKAF